MDPDEVRQILVLLDESIRDSHRSRREVERALGLGQGYLGSLFRGRIQLKVGHVYMLARELGLDPLTFFLKASPPGNRPPPIAPIESPLPLPEAAAMNREEIEELVVRTLHDELARLATLGPGRKTAS